MSHRLLLSVLIPPPPLTACAPHFLKEWLRGSPEDHTLDGENLLPACTGERRPYDRAFSAHRQPPPRTGNISTTQTGSTCSTSRSTPVRKMICAVISRCASKRSSAAIRPGTRRCCGARRQNLPPDEARRRAH